ncbi:SMP-30/gluconolactonase/LRE family protein [Celeribacter arenosi]|uniref:SMP-30/gluconolactonase/LRE family protein n=1 Tax=Celeribacter arenosi TaxID=792649 RepID=A0ABP7K1D2_9RHOB
MTYEIFDDRVCALGEGPLWHPEREQFFWFDIIGHKLLTRENGEANEWQFDEFISAAGWVDRETLLVASETSLSTLNLETGETSFVASLESDNPVTRSNDGRADPYGGFWIGTMGKNAEAGAGAIYRYYRGQLRKLFDKITISNAICFSPDGKTAYFTDTRVGDIMSVPLGDEGWPSAKPQVFIKDAAHPDGAVVDAQGNLWNAVWGGHGVSVYSPQGEKLRHYDLPAAQTTCPAFGGADGTTLYVTSAAVGLEEGGDQGKTFSIETGIKGQKEHRIIL